MNTLEQIKALMAEHIAFCSMGQEILCAIDPAGDREREILDRLFDAYEQDVIAEDDDQLAEWWDLEDDEKYYTIEELLEAA